jgi:hypothetical protein
MELKILLGPEEPEKVKGRGNGQSYGLGKLEGEGESLKKKFW